MNYLDLYEMPDGSVIADDDDYWAEGEFITPIFFPTEPQKKYNGFNCIKCNEFNKFAEPNQKDGSFKCFSCRKYG